MTITLRADSGLQWTVVASSPLVITKPTGTADGDTMMAMIWGASATVTSAPAGWTLMGGSEASQLLIYKKQALSEGATYSWAFSGAGSYLFGVVASFSSLRYTDLSALEVSPGLSWDTSVGWFNGTQRARISEPDSSLAYNAGFHAFAAFRYHYSGGAVAKTISHGGPWTKHAQYDTTASVPGFGIGIAYYTLEWPRRYNHPGLSVWAMPDQPNYVGGGNWTYRAASDPLVAAPASSTDAWGFVL